jgi:acyl-CoA synthetase
VAEAAGERRWPQRPLPDDLRQRYLTEGWWGDATLAAMVAEGLAGLGRVRFQVHSDVHPYDGTFEEFDRAARSLAAALTRRGIGPGSVVAFQLPNWVEAGVTFWAAAYLGAVVVPIVHFYGPKELDYILRALRPDVVVTADRFGRTDYLDVYDGLLRQQPPELWLVAGSSTGALPEPARAFASMLDEGPRFAPSSVDPDAPAIVAFTSGTTRDPKGVVHSQRTIAFETGQLEYMYPRGGHRTSPAPPSVILSACSTPSSSHFSGPDRFT